MQRSTTCIYQLFCIIKPRAPKHVSNAVQLLRAYNVEFAVRSGGRSSTPGAPSIGTEDVLLDISMLNRLNLSDDVSVVSVDPRQRWGAVASYLHPYKLTIIGARAPFVGVGASFLVVSFCLEKGSI